MGAGGSFSKPEKAADIGQPLSLSVRRILKPSRDGRAERLVDLTLNHYRLGAARAGVRS